MTCTLYFIVIFVCYMDLTKLIKYNACWNKLKWNCINFIMKGKLLLVFYFIEEAKDFFKSFICV